MRYSYKEIRDFVKCKRYGSRTYGKWGSLNNNIKDTIMELVTNCECYDITIKNLLKENEKLKEQNNDLRKIYRNTYKRLFKNGNDELARYFQAQIDDCPTFYVEPIIDYAKEYEDYKSRCEKANKLLKTIYKALPGTYNQLLIEIDNYLQGSDEK